MFLISYTKNKLQFCKNSNVRAHVTTDQIRCRRVASCVQPAGQTLQIAKTHGLGPQDNGAALTNRLKNKGGQ